MINRKGFTLGYSRHELVPGFRTSIATKSPVRPASELSCSHQLRIEVAENATFQAQLDYSGLPVPQKGLSRVNHGWLKPYGLLWPHDSVL
jgi:hypothetical protein